MIWYYNNNTKIIYGSTSIEKLGTELDKNLQQKAVEMSRYVNNEVTIVYINDDLQYDEGSYQDYLKRLKNNILQQTDWKITRHTEEIALEVTPTLSKDELTRVRNLRNAIRRASTIEELNNINNGSY